MLQYYPSSSKLAQILGFLASLSANRDRSTSSKVLSALAQAQLQFCIRKHLHPDGPSILVPPLKKTLLNKKTRADPYLIATQILGDFTLVLSH